MGAIQNSVLGAIRSIGVARHAAKIGQAITEANDGELAELMNLKSSNNKEKLLLEKRQLKLRRKKIRLAEKKVKIEESKLKDQEVLKKKEREGDK